MHAVARSVVSLLCLTACGKMRDGARDFLDEGGARRGGSASDAGFESGARRSVTLDAAVASDRSVPATSTHNAEGGPTDASSHPVLTDGSRLTCDGGRAGLEGPRSCDALAIDAAPDVHVDAAPDVHVDATTEPCPPEQDALRRLPCAVAGRSCDYGTECCDGRCSASTVCDCVLGRWSCWATDACLGWP